MEDANGASRCPKCNRLPAAYKLNDTQFLIECIYHRDYVALGNTLTQALHHWDRLIALSREVKS